MLGVKGPGQTKTYDGSALRIGIVHARWNSQIIDALLSGCLSTLQASGVSTDNIVIQSVPGSFELPYAVQRMYAASQAQASANSTGILASAADLLSSSVTSRGSEVDQPTEQNTVGNGSNAAFDAVIAIGVLIKGSTMHFEYIADAVSHALMKVQMEKDVPVIFGLLTLLTEEQGLERAGIDKAGKGHNHGEDWGAAAVELGLKRRAWADGRFLE